MSEDTCGARTALLEPGIRSVQARVLAIELAERRVATDQVTLRFDQLIVAVGADPNFAAIPGLAEAAESFYTVEGAQRLRHALERFSGGELVLLIPRVPFKCPPAPYEAAMLLQHAFERRGLGGKARITFCTAEPAPMPPAGAEMGQYIRTQLQSREIAHQPQKQNALRGRPARCVVFDDCRQA